MALQLKGQCVKSRIIAVRPAGIAVRGSANTLCGDPRLVKASRFIETNIHQPLGTPDVAQHLGISRSTLDRLAVKQLGCSIPGMITNRRLEHAKHLLNDTSLTLDAIAKQTGFTSPQYFCAVFKRHFGYTPLAYRQKHARHSVAQSPKM